MNGCQSRKGPCLVSPLSCVNSSRDGLNPLRPPGVWTVIFTPTPPGNLLDTVLEDRLSVWPFDMAQDPPTMSPPPRSVILLFKF